jgi:hypothetical protein
VGEDAELLPGAVGPAVPGRDDIEGELALELAVTDDVWGLDELIATL